ncbi:GntR family transcriptional regulator [Saccharobesus litoralis]|uniref:GntR family transcriptional regulator n=1 Tax=Saccharobesus litoralis TaxID=2172099 RepID=A0A2S0VPW0_9ALTE|nr:GntR family transcriptional regulator [Saccharobesus litoralis]AWB66244.1 GntR family transcriptional regulator [Saccharobesus litoralis]
MPEPVTPPAMSPLLLNDNSIYAQILNDIAEGVYISGDRLVTTSLAKRYHTSINPVREALKQLQGEGFVTVQPNSGARVAKFEYATMRDVFELLALLEPYLLEWFVTEHSQEQLEKVIAIQGEMEKLTEAEHLTYRAYDNQFHWYIYSCHYNQTTVELWRQKRLMLHAMHASLTLTQSRMQQSISEHRQLIQAISKRDVDQALSILNGHISHSGQYWSRYL